MKTQVRRGVFETNSSSVHSICITTEDEFEHFPAEVVFTPGEFGWESDRYYDLESKASYLWTAIINYVDEMCWYDVETCKKMIVATLEKYNIKAIFIGGIPGERYSATGYIDHGNELDEFIKDVVNDEDRLMQYLFSDRSYVATGNDNDDTIPYIDATYPHEVYNKYN